MKQRISKYEIDALIKAMMNNFISIELVASILQLITENYDIEGEHE